MRLALATVGSISIVGQVLMMRELAATFYGNELVYGLCLALWMLWVAAGAAVGSRFGGRVGPRGYGLQLAASGLFLVVQIAFVRGVRPGLGVTPGAIPGMGLAVLTTALSLAPLCLLIGMLFVSGARLLAAQSCPVGRAYAFETVGSAAGGALFSLVLVSRLAPLQLAVAVCGFGTLVWALVVGWPRQRSSADRRRTAVVPAMLGAVVILLALPGGAELERRTLDWSWPGRVAAVDSPYGRLIVTARDSQRAFYQDGRLLFETQSTRPEEVAHLPLLAHPEPRRVLLVGGGIDGTLGEIVKHPVRAVTYAEIDPQLIATARAVLSPTEVGALDDPRVTVATTDGRRALRTSAEPFDVIVVNVPPPETGQLNRFYTREFFSELAAALRPGGVVALGLPSAETYWSPALRQRNSSIFRTLGAVFPNVLVTPGDTIHLLASSADLTLDADVLSRRLLERGIEARWMTADRLRYLLDPLRAAALRESLAAGRTPAINRDSAPIAYFYELTLWLSRVSGRLAPDPDTGSLRIALVVASLMAAGALLGRRRTSEGLATAVLVSGFSVMALEVTVLLAFQSADGSLYARIAVIMATFLGGMALGAGVVSRPTRRALAGAQVGMALAALLVVALSGVLRAQPLAVSGALGMTVGALGGAVFALAAGLAAGSAQAIAGRLYAIDLVGGASGAIAASLLLVPVLGIPTTCLLVAMLNVAVAIAGSAAAAPARGATSARPSGRSRTG